MMPSYLHEEDMTQADKMEPWSEHALVGGVRITMYDSVYYQNEFGLPPHNAKDFITWLNSIVEKAPPKLRDKVVFERWSDGQRDGYEVSYIRNLTAVEVAAVDAELRPQQEIQRAAELAQLHALLKKYKDQV